MQSMYHAEGEVTGESERVMKQNQSRNLRISSESPHAPPKLIISTVLYQKLFERNNYTHNRKQLRLNEIWCTTKFISYASFPNCITFF
jgi:hypothetical protein